MFLGTGNFTYIDLSGNDLTRFEEDIFKPILSTMKAMDDAKNADVAGLNIEQSNVSFFHAIIIKYLLNTRIFLLLIDSFDCCKHLVWLVRDNRQLLKYIWNTAACDGIVYRTPFTYLSPADLDNRNCIND